MGAGRRTLPRSPQIRRPDDKPLGDRGPLAEGSPNQQIADKMTVGRMPVHGSNGGRSANCGSAASFRPKMRLSNQSRRYPGGLPMMSRKTTVKRATFGRTKRTGTANIHEHLSTEIAAKVAITRSEERRV